MPPLVSVWSALVFISSICLVGCFPHGCVTVICRMLYAFWRGNKYGCMRHFRVYLYWLSQNYLCSTMDVYKTLGMSCRMFCAFWCGTSMRQCVLIWIFFLMFYLSGYAKVAYVLAFVIFSWALVFLVWCYIYRSLHMCAACNVIMLAQKVEKGQFWWFISQLVYIICQKWS